MRDHYQVHECFWSIQGEGVHAGTTAVFLRLQGCPVGCAWCDAKLTWFRGGTRMTLDQIDAMIDALPGYTWLIITGGEPLLYDLDPLLARYAAVQTLIETSGAYPFKGRLRPDWLCVSPKYTVDYRVAPDVLKAAHELKYVVDEHLDDGVIRRHLYERAESGATRAVALSLMPEGSPPRDVMVRRTLAMLKQHPTARFSPRLQYAYRAIRDGEGDTNQQLTREAARAASSHI